MAMTPDEIRAYGRGYNAGRHNSWPPHLPPIPPDSVIRRLMDAVVQIRFYADELHATFDPDDEVVQTFGRMIDEADAAIISVENWMLECGVDTESGAAPLISPSASAEGPGRIPNKADGAAPTIQADEVA